VEYIDTPSSGVAGIVNPETALMTGRIQTTDVAELVRFQQAFPLTPQRVMDFSERIRNAAPVTGALTTQSKADLIFADILPGFFQPGRVPGWSTNLHFKIADAGMRG